MRSAFLFCCLALVLVSCKKEQQAAAPINLAIAGDTFIRPKPVMVNGVAQSAECRNAFSGSVRGGTGGGEVTIVGGHVEFRADGSSRATYAWDSTNIATVWPERTIKSGAGRASLPFGLSVSLPMREMEGVITFDYKVKGEPDVRTTAPFIYKCL